MVVTVVMQPSLVEVQGLALLHTRLPIAVSLWQVKATTSIPRQRLRVPARQALEHIQHTMADVRLLLRRRLDKQLRGLTITSAMPLWSVALERRVQQDMAPMKPLILKRPRHMMRIRLPALRHRITMIPHRSTLTMTHTRQNITLTEIWTGGNRPRAAR